MSKEERANVRLDGQGAPPEQCKQSREPSVDSDHAPLHRFRQPVHKGDQMTVFKSNFPLSSIWHQLRRAPQELPYVDAPDPKMLVTTMLSCHHFRLQNVLPLSCAFVSAIVTVVTAVHGVAVLLSLCCRCASLRLKATTCKM